MAGNKQLAFKKSRPDSDAVGEAVHDVITPTKLVYDRGGRVCENQWAMIRIKSYTRGSLVRFALSFCV
jgi:hypothetical protein